MAALALSLASSTRAPLVVPASSFERELGYRTVTATTFAGAPLASHAAATRGKVLTEFAHCCEPELHPGAVLEETVAGERVDVTRRGPNSAAYDWQRDGRRVACESAQLVWKSDAERWKLLFDNVRLATVGGSDAAFDELLLAAYTPEGVHLFRHDLRAGVGTAGVSTAATGKEITFAGPMHEPDWRVALDEILGKMKARGCRRLALVPWGERTEPRARRAHVVASVVPPPSPRAIVLVADAAAPENAALELISTLRSQGWSVRPVTNAAAQADALLSDGLLPDVIFELQLTPRSMELQEAASASQRCSLYRWQPASATFKRCTPDNGSGLPAHISPAPSFEAEAESRGWGFLDLSGLHEDDADEIDVSTLSDAELARLLDLPLPAAPTTPASRAIREQPPIFCELGYATTAAPLAPAADLSPLARRCLFDSATEPPRARTTADGSAWPQAGREGAFVSGASGVPLYLSEDLLSCTEWPAFRVGGALSGGGGAGGGREGGEGGAARLALRDDFGGGMRRTEIYESRGGDDGGGSGRDDCGGEGGGGSFVAHLGHRFPTHDCVNGAALRFVPRGEAPPVLPASPAAARLLTSAPEWLGRYRLATLAAGCFWGVRARLAALPGVLCAVAGYCGGHGDGSRAEAGAGAASEAPPSYAEVCTGRSGYVEAVQLAYDPRQTSYAALLGAFWAMHDPASALRQGADVGPQYACAIFYHSHAQRRAAVASRAAVQAELLRASRAELAAAAEYEATADVVTQVRPARAFYAAEDEHQRR